jgi:hypothetical protein
LALVLKQALIGGSCWRGDSGESSAYPCDRGLVSLVAWGFGFLGGVLLQSRLGGLAEDVSPPEGTIADRRAVLTRR